MADENVLQFPGIEDDAPETDAAPTQEQTTEAPEAKPLDLRSAIESILPTTDRVKVGEEEYKINEFCMAKAMRMTVYVTDLTNLFGSVPEAPPKQLSFQADNGEIVTVDVPESWVARIVRLAPVALKEGSEPLYRILGLIITPNKELREWDEADADVEQNLLKRGKGLTYEGTVDDMLSVIGVGVAKVGLDSILGKGSRLMDLLKVR